MDNRASSAMDGTPGRKNEPEKGQGPQATPLDLAHHRNRLAGLWAAELLGLIGHAAQDYARSVMHPDHAQDAVHEDDRERVISKLAKDLAGRATMAEIREKMAHFLNEARQILHDKRD